ncbi:class I SAM-dependent DNA methyltransferase [Chryseobacterium jejuense]|uniref:Methyltransferase domain-containing protein n=1 Tax=Chryseobacterium jejuense TaxID=445960 RepID=A0A2X2WZN6_CHRJE|nr:class I SAM-dependent methyltransferase [Chryseobacterium jejuense]SDJ58408.1 Methyltransferase domain-containing protein [Chryseobacterium jejuense]SQB46118.1 ubiquinone/menaquinone biosynthesis methyltransferase [Chryseobacterium jejuense]
MKTSILEYYSNLAESYDENRFGNSYGKYIDHQERAFLASFFKDKKYTKVLDLGCGTGRLLNFATHGTDFSENMLKVAHQKHPEKKLAVGEISGIPFHDEFDCIFCFHVIMHQNQEETKEFLNECYQKLNKNGTLIFDYPVKSRKKSVSPQEDWHAGNSFSIADITELSKGQWNVKSTTGILFFPIHRLPKAIRKFFLPLDIFLCRTFLKNWASYHISVLEKV